MRNATERLRRRAKQQLQGRGTCAGRKGDAHWKALGRPLLDVEASQIPVELSSGNRHGSSCGIEGTARASASTSSSSSSRHVCLLRLTGGLMHVKGIGLNSRQVSSNERLERVVESEIISVQLGPRPLLARLRLRVGPQNRTCTQSPATSLHEHHTSTRSRYDKVTRTRPSTSLDRVIIAE